MTNVSGALRFTLLTPALLRADSQENIYLQADDLSVPVTATIVIQDFDETVALLQDSVRLNPGNRHKALKTIEVRKTRAIQNMLWRNFHRRGVFTLISHKPP